MKTCNKCGKKKSESAFVKSKTCAGGVAGTCLTCSNAYCAAWKRKNQKRLSEARRKRYAETEGLEVKERERIRYEKQPLRVICQRLCGGMRERSRLGRLPFDSEVLTVKFLMARIEAKPKCECCGVPFAIGGVKNGVQVAASPSVDRIKPKLGYTLKNLAILCWRCNNLKRDSHPAELQRVADWMRASWGNEIANDVEMPNQKLTDA